MKVTGYLIREAIKRHELRRDTSAKTFPEVLHSFVGDNKHTPDEIIARFRASEDAVAALQVAQARYNLIIEITALDQKMTLMEAVKRIGGAGRLEKMWRDSVIPKSDRYSYRDESMERDTTKVYAKPTMTQDEREDRANKAASRASAIRAAIAAGNATEVDAEAIGLDPKLFTE